MKEDVLQFIWKYQLLERKAFFTSKGELIEIIKPGFQNTDSGPDFNDALIRIGDTLWAGNIEIHTNASDWYNHKHHSDPAYNNTILHVVFRNDLPNARYNEINIPHLLLSDIINPEIIRNYSLLLSSKLWIPCIENINNISSITLFNWLERMLIERLESRYNRITTTLLKNNSDWNETFHQLLARNFGFKTNGDSFERLAIITPLKILSRHKNNPLQLEALLFGQAGLLKDEPADEYTTMLKKEYSFLQKKYGLTPMQSSEWKFARMHPPNFPTIRISQYANLIYKSQGLFSQIIEIRNFSDLYNYFNLCASAYWDDHFTFNGPRGQRKPKKTGQDAINNILINTIIPFIFTWGKEKNSRTLTSLSFNFLEKIPKEKNSTLTKWEEYGFKNNTAADSQALLHLKTNYCDYKKCLECSIGVNILKEKRNFEVQLKN